MKVAKTRYEREGVELENVFSALNRSKGKYLHFTNADKLGINVKGVYPGINPIGIYGYAIDNELISSIVEGQHSFFVSNMESVNLYRYLYIFDAKGKTLDLNKLDQNEFKNIIKEMIQHDMVLAPAVPDTLEEKVQEYINRMRRVHPPQNSYADHFRHTLGEALMHSGIGNDHLAVNVILRKIGYDAVKGFISAGHTDEICIINPRALVVLDKLQNPIFDEYEYKKVQQYRLERAANAYYEKAIQT